MDKKTYTIVEIYMGYKTVETRTRLVFESEKAALLACEELNRRAPKGRMGERTIHDVREIK